MDITVEKKTYPRKSTVWKVQVNDERISTKQAALLIRSRFPFCKRDQLVFEDNVLTLSFQIGVSKFNNILRDLPITVTKYMPTQLTREEQDEVAEILRNIQDE